MGNRLIIFDVCNTLVDIDSTKFYIDFLQDNGHGNKWLLKAFKSRLFFLVSSIINKIFKYNIHRKLTFWIFRGADSDQFKNLNKLFLDKYLIKTKSLLEKLIEHRDLGEKVVLMSASINPPIEILGEYLGVDTYSSKLIVKDSRYTGEVEWDLLGKKENVFEKGHIDLNEFTEIIFYTDNLDDGGAIKYIHDSSKDYKIFLIINNIKVKIKWEIFLYDNKISNYEFVS